MVELVPELQSKRSICIGYASRFGASLLLLANHRIILTLEDIHEANCAVGKCYTPNGELVDIRLPIFPTPVPLFPNHFRSYPVGYYITSSFFLNSEGCQ